MVKGELLSDHHLVLLLEVFSPTFVINSVTKFTMPYACEDKFANESSVIFILFQHVATEQQQTNSQNNVPLFLYSCNMNIIV